MSNISGLLGTAGGFNGTGADGPAGVDILAPVTSKQAGDAYDQAQLALQAQQGFVGALQGQNALQNQTNVYNQLQNVAAGQGPNPAQAMLQQQTGQNMAQQASLMAGQRGVNANTGLIARQVAQQGANTQQQATGQAATMQAQQSLNALQQSGAMANTQAGQLQNATATYNQAAQGEQSNLLNSIAQANNAKIGMQSNLNNVNSGIIGATMGQQASIGSSMSSSIGSAFGMNKGGEVPNSYAYGGVTGTTSIPGDPSGGQSNVLQYFSQIANVGKKGKGGDKSSSPSDSKTTQGQSSQWEVGGGMAGGPMDTNSNQIESPNSLAAAHGGKVPALVSPGEVYLDKSAVKEVESGKDPIKAGEKIKGKAKVKGDSLKNDIVPKSLESGGIVLPKSVMESKHPHWEAHKFVSAIMAKHGKLSSKRSK